MSIRNEWRFQFRASEIAKAARKEEEYHRLRVDYWKQELEQAIVQAKSAGVDIREYEVTGGKQVQVVLDPTVQTRLSQSQSKIQAHLRAQDEYSQWADALERGMQKAYDLDPQDVAYFRIAGGERPE